MLYITSRKNAYSGRRKAYQKLPSLAHGEWSQFEQLLESLGVLDFYRMEDQIYYDSTLQEFAEVLALGVSELIRRTNTELGIEEPLAEDDWRLGWRNSRLENSSNYTLLKRVKSDVSRALEEGLAIVFLSN